MKTPAWQRAFLLAALSLRPRPLLRSLALLKLPLLHGGEARNLLLRRHVPAVVADLA